MPTVYETLENSYDKLQDFFDNNQFGPEVFPLILKQEELSEKLEALDIKAIEKNSVDLQQLHLGFKELEKSAKEMVADLEETIDMIDKVAKVTKSVDKIISNISKLL